MKRKIIRSYIVLHMFFTLVSCLHDISNWEIYINHTPEIQAQEEIYE